MAQLSHGMYIFRETRAVRSEDEGMFNVQLKLFVGSEASQVTLMADSAFASTPTLSTKTEDKPYIYAL